jgi:cellulose biosynthesis protein BcsQ
MNKKSIYVAFSNQKGGVGKSAFTTLAASYLHYAGGKNVAVIDCDYPQHSIFAMRERDKSFVMSNDRLKVMIASQFQGLDKKAYSILTAKPENALECARQFQEAIELKIDVVFFDLSGTVSSPGILQLMLNMDYIFCPITTDRLVMQSSLTFASIIKDCLSKHQNVPLKGFQFFWNQLVKSENRSVYDAYCAIIEQLKLDVMKTEIPFTIKYKREMSANGKQIFRSTLFPPDRALIKGTCFDELMDEMCQIIKLQ